MPWNEEDCPVEMRDLPGPVREKAIDIANALVDSDWDEERAIRVGIARAREWAERHWSGEYDRDPAGIPAEQD